MITCGMELYEGPICDIMWAAPVHLIPEAHIMAGIAVVMVRCYKASIDPPFLLVNLQRRPVTLLVAAKAAAVCVLNTR